ncbi:MAG: isoleucine--tRNA ligase [Gammaproteobacteria bacterium]|nr:isoleucine--tRNA ligase [Gammaproteobacteria bacterium]
MDYKSTLNLPHTAFPMKANLAGREPARLAGWQSAALYEQIRVARRGEKQFILHDGPPYANGHLHAGHALNKILKDIIVKSKTMSGYDAPYRPGWDCHGLPIELNVEKKVGKAGVKVDAKTFRLHCRKYASSQIDIQKSEFERLGVVGEWQNPYITMDYHYEANVVRALGQILAGGHLQQGFKPVHWCLDCRSALAEAEVEYEDKQSPSIDVAFKAEANQAVLAGFNLDDKKTVIVPIWTTTPWTLPANEAVSLHPELMYALIDTGTQYFVIAKELVESVCARYGIAEWTVSAEIEGAALENIRLQHPLFDDRTVPVVLSTHVTTESGTGCVHTAPAHGPDDYLVGLKYKLPCANPVLGNGNYTEETPLFAGLSVRNSDKIILETLRDRRVLLHDVVLSHSYPHCWRHKSPIIFRATPQWFIGMDKAGLRTALLDQISTVTWIPGWGEARIRSMVEGRPDWCISRQRAWGIPIPFFMHRTTGELHPETPALLEAVALKIEDGGIEAWFELNPAELLGDAHEDYEKSMDVLDVWFDSGVSHRTVLNPDGGNQVVADLYLEGSDQHRGWFNSSLTTAVGMNNVPPYRSVLTHGYTVDSDGKKFSKSKGNYVALDKLIKQYGADILRLWVASADYKQDVSLSEEIIKRNADVYRRIRNTMRFLLSNLFDFEFERDSLPVSEWVKIDKFIVARAQALQAEVLAAYETYQFHLIYQKIHQFCAIDLGGFYLDIIKDRQYTTAENSVARRSCQNAMYHIIHMLVRLLAPILSFTADEVWDVLPGKTDNPLFLETWYTAWPEGLAESDAINWDEIYSIREAVNQALEIARKGGVIGSALAAEIDLYVDDTTRAMLEPLGEELRFVLITSGVNLLSLDDKPDDVLDSAMSGLAVSVKSSNATKCVRCWHRVDDIGENTQHPGLCGRCITNLSGAGEARTWA